jgi:hypothetical protein
LAFPYRLLLRWILSGWPEKLCQTYAFTPGKPATVLDIRIRHRHCVGNDAHYALILLLRLACGDQYGSDSGSWGVISTSIKDLVASAWDARLITFLRAQEQREEFLKKRVHERLRFNEMDKQLEQMESELYQGRFEPEDPVLRPLEGAGQEAV